MHPIFLSHLFCTHGWSLLQLATGGRCGLWASRQFMTEVSTVTNNCILGHTLTQFRATNEPNQHVNPLGECKFHIEQPLCSCFEATMPTTTLFRSRHGNILCISATRWLAWHDSQKHAVAAAALRHISNKTTTRC